MSVVPVRSPSHAEVPTPDAPPRAVTFRAVALGLLLLPLNAYWLVMMEVVRYSAHPTTISLFFNCIFFLVVLTGINFLVGRVTPKFALRQGELLLIYSILCIGSCMGAHDFGQVLVPSLAWPYGHADAGNGYAQLFWRYLPSWALMPDLEASRTFNAGNSTLYKWENWTPWIRPMLVWTVFVTVLLFTMQCVNVLIRKQWTESERLTYPLTRIPLEITDAQPGGRGRTGIPLTKNRLFWGGFVLAAAIDTVNSLNYYFPGVPAILTPGHGASFFNLQDYVTNRPWNAIGWTPASFYPFLIGLGVLMPTDFLFSSWFFYLIWKLQSIVVVANAWDGDARMPYANYQGFGAYLLFFVSTLYLSRGYLQRIWVCALGKPSDIDDSDEPLRYRSAFLGLAVGLIALVAFTVVLGLAWWLAVLFFLIYFALALAITRMRAELGTPVHDLHFTGPDWALTDLIGSRDIAPGGLAVFSMFYWFNRAYRSHPMPFQLEAFKMAEQTGARREMRRWFWVLILAGAVGLVCAFWATLYTDYRDGASAKVAQRFGGEAWDRYGGWLKQPKAGSVPVAVAIGVGFAFAAFLQVMRVNFAWWPFHPLAYAVSGSWEMNLLWLPLFIAWAAKSLLLRYGGGVQTYQKSLPFFYGLILGQFIPGSLLNIWGIWTNTPTYQFWQ